MIATHTFRLVLDRPPTDREFDVLADSLVHAIASAIADLEAHGLVVQAVEPVGLIRDEDIEARADRPRWQLDALIERSPVAHSKPMADHGSPEAPFYAWDEVREWLAAHGIPTAYDETIAAANATLATGTRRDVGPLEVVIQHHLDRSRRWRMPEWMKPYCSFIANTGGTHPNTPEQIEELIFRLDYERNLAFTNIVVFTIAAGVREQVGLLTRLYESNCLLPPITNGGW